MQTISRCAEHSYQVQWPTADTDESLISYETVKCRELPVSVPECVCEKMTKADVMLEGVFLLCLFNYNNVH